MLQIVYYYFVDPNKSEAISKIKSIPDMKDLILLPQELPLPLHSLNTVFISDQDTYCLEAAEAGYPVILVEELLSGQSSMRIRYLVTSIDAITRQYLEEVYARFHKLPIKILETDRCMIRETSLDDLDRFYEIYAQDGMTDFLEPLFEEYEKEETYIQSYIDHVYSFYGYGMWSIVDKVSGVVIGRAGVEYKEEQDGLELGYLIEKSYQRKGYASEVCNAIVKYVLEHLEVTKIYSYIHPDNVASVNLCKKLGFKEQGILEKEGVILCKYVWQQNFMV